MPVIRATFVGGDGEPFFSSEDAIVEFREEGGERKWVCFVCVWVGIWEGNGGGLCR